jgi:hypothetical protein
MQVIGAPGKSMSQLSLMPPVREARQETIYIDRRVQRASLDTSRGNIRELDVANSSPLHVVGGLLGRR